jgi:oxygen-independent coproporphyrinogen III oxidase
MPGIYLHIPFCKQACNYCDFHFSTSLTSKSAMVAAIQNELIQRKEYTGSGIIETIYFGGGTPSLLTKADLLQIFDTIYANFNVASDAEITLEANPDDLTPDYLKELKTTPVNRLSIGIQSFRNEDLLWMNRAHHSGQALSCVEEAAAAGFNNISIDLIYGIPDMTNDQWKENLKIALQLPVTHLSCYCLTVEPKTALGHFVSKKYLKMPEDELTSIQFKTLLSAAEKAGFIQYEISNLCKPGYFSKHNTSYWKGIHYLGVGPSAHSFNGITREWNVSKNALYIKSVMENNRKSESEVLTTENRFNEYIMVSLRTMWGIDLNYLKSTFSDDYYKHLLTEATPFIAGGDLVTNNDHLYLSISGKLIADKLASDLFI